MSIKNHYVSGIIIRRSTSTFASGGTSLSWATHLTVDGLIRQASDREIDLAERIGSKTTHVLYTDVADITAEDRVYYDSKEYKITGAPKDPNNRGHHFEINLELIE